MHQGSSIFSFEKQQEAGQQNRGSDELRASQTGFVAGGHPLVAIEEAEEEEGGNNMLSEMFNYAGPADVLATSHESSTNPAVGYHRLIHQIRPDFYNRQQGVMMSGSNWSSSAVHEDAAALAAKQHGMNPAADSCSSSSSSTAMRMFFMNPAMQHHQRASASPDQSPMGPAALFHHQQQQQQHEQSQAFLFGEGMGFGGGMRERQLGPSLSLSSSLQQLEMRKAEEPIRGLLFYNGQEQQEVQPPPPLAATCLQTHGGQYEQLQMPSSTYGSMSTANVLRNSRYARAAQELLEEFCSVSRGHVRGNPGTKLSHGGGGASSSAAAAASYSSSKDVPPFSPADRFENQRKKSKLLSMLDEVERRYNHYCEQMQMVVNSFDSVMGFGAAMPYTSLARKAMSRHFRCLKDAITAQLKRTCELLGDNDGGSGSGLTKGETPKLRLIDQTLRQQRAFHQMGTMEQEAWRPQRGLPDRSVTILRSWLFEHFLHPYPSDADKHLLARKTGLSRNQVSNWFINARVRLWKPMVEDMYQQEAKENEVLLAAPPPTHPQQRHSPESDDPTLPQLAHHYDQPPPPPPDHDAASNPLVFQPPPLDDEMYRRAAAAAAASRTGDLSLTLGLRHAGGNAPADMCGRFGL